MAKEMKELLKHELGDLLYAEQLILKMLGTLTREVKNPEMLARVQQHIGETEGQIQRLKRAFETIGEKAKAEKCAAAVGLKEEHDSFKKEEKPSKQLLEAFDLGNGLRVEHYEIAGYRSAIAVASVLGATECVALLNESLREEEQMAAFLERNAVKALKMLSAGMDFADGKSEVLFTAETGPRRRGTAAKSTAAKSTAKKSTAKKTAKSASARAGGSRSSGRSTADSGSSGSKASGSRSSGGSSSAGKSGGGKSGGTRSASARASGGSSSRTTAERSSGSRSSGGKSGGGAAKSSSRSGGSSSKSGGGKSGGSRSRSGGSGSSARS